MEAKALKERAVFLDRDGTIIQDVGHISSPDQVVFFPDAFSSLRRLQKEFMLFIVTHQGGVGKGIITREQADEVNDCIVARLAREGINITEVYVCPHAREEDCECIKPKPFHLLQAAEKYGIDLRRSFAVGDHPHDVELASNVGGKGIFVMTGHGRKHAAELSGHEMIAENLGRAVDLIMGEFRSGGS